jgi:hypothetical protein
LEYFHLNLFVLIVMPFLVQQLRSHKQIRITPTLHAAMFSLIPL